MIDTSNLDAAFENDIRINVPEYTYHFELDNVPYFQPKRLTDRNGNLVDYCPELKAFMAYKTTQVGEDLSFTLCNKQRMRLYSVEEQDLLPFTEDGIVQITSYNCGPASALQVLDILNANGIHTRPVPIKTKELWYSYECCINHNPEDTSPHNQAHHPIQDHPEYIDTHPPYCPCHGLYSDRQVSMMELTNTTWHGTPEAEKIADAINHFTEKKQYTFSDINNQNPEDIYLLRATTLTNLKNGYPVVFMVNVKSLKRYFSANPETVARHYITAIGYKTNTDNLLEDEIEVIDANYTSTRRGKYTVRLGELLHSMTQAGVQRNGNFIFADLPTNNRNNQE